MALTEKEKTKRRARYQERRKEILAYQKQWREQNPEKVANYQYRSWMKKANNEKRI